MSKYTRTIKSVSKEFEDYYKIGNLYLPDWNSRNPMLLLMGFHAEARNYFHDQRPSVRFVWKFYDLTENCVSEDALLVRSNDITSAIKPEAYYKKI